MNRKEVARLNGGDSRNLDKKRKKNRVIAEGGMQDGGSFVCYFAGLRRHEHD